MLWPLLSSNIFYTYEKWGTQFEVDLSWIKHLGVRSQKWSTDGKVISGHEEGAFCSSECVEENTTTTLQPYSKTHPEETSRWEYMCMCNTMLLNWHFIEWQQTLVVLRSPTCTTFNSFVLSISRIARPDSALMLHFSKNVVIRPIYPFYWWSKSPFRYFGSRCLGGWPVRYTL